MGRPYTRIFPISLGTTWEEIEENPYRLGLLIQNLSVNTVYIATVKDTAQAIELDAGDEYHSETCKGQLFISASAAGSDVRIQEDVARN